MIADKDRSGWFGASDTMYIMGNWKIKTFDEWWKVKLGFIEKQLDNKYTKAGTEYEHKIIDALDIEVEKDKQILLPQYRLRVNLDANTDTTIYEIKTYKAENGFEKPPKKYIEQVQVQMFATGLRDAYIIAYPMTNEHYENYFLDIDKSLIKRFRIEYDGNFITKYMQRLIYLKDCLIKGVFPDAREIRLNQC